MSLKMDRVEALPDGAGLPRQYCYLVARNGGTVKVPMSGPDGEQIVAVLAFTRPDLAAEYVRMWRETAGFPEGVRVARLRRSHPEARHMPQEVWIETFDGRARAEVRLGIDARLGAERN